MLYGLKKGQAKMSKSDPDSAIFMEDAPEDVQRKLSNAYCPVEAEVAELAVDDGNEMQLVKDELKNPCLDYAQYIVFSREGATVEISGRIYSDFTELKSAFVSGDVKEEELKTCLAAEVNNILEPVRRHFMEDATAKGLLEQVKQWKRESLEVTSAITRLQLSSEAGGTAVGRSCVVFAPLPSERVLLGDVWNTAARLRQAPEDSVPLLWLSDWSARTLGCVGGAEERIRGYYDLLLHGLRSLAPDLMERVRVVWQGQAILSDPEPYWTSVINAGRQCSLEAVRKSLPQGEDLEGAGQVIASIMHVGDVLALAHKDNALIICDEHGQDGLHQLAAEHLVRCGLPKPMLQTTEAVSLRLQAEGEGLEADTNVSLTDAVPDVSRKIKKAFCEPENVNFCPPLLWVSDFLLPLQGEFVVKRKPANGGDKVYTSADDVSADFADGSLHPADLKPALGKALNVALDGVRAGVKSSKELKRAQKKLDDFIKAQQKKQKKNN
jgi:tyrosyl-tRNA synthetase